ncbi:hypothetical protein BRCON_0906 [Candidatus Sumerlaea chitinivorans]|uniref:Uncharacterized protein n=1 Tax=Sumerlaea chitinivorans TaxID=2250252 RepID=A0A2Z4Y591_SUMC1|nr:hypothetical protein BRCON_0906 [Candidatus Sumerlaea chitinivorans]
MNGAFRYRVVRERTGKQKDFLSSHALRKLVLFESAFACGIFHYATIYS